MANFILNKEHDGLAQENVVLTPTTTKRLSAIDESGNICFFDVELEAGQHLFDVLADYKKNYDDMSDWQVEPDPKDYH